MKARDVAQSLFPEIQADKPIGYILPSVLEGSNAELMRAIAPFYLTGSVLDCAYGKGNWWTLFRPEDFVAHDLYTLDGVDFTALPEPDGSIDTVCYDPPYIAAGGTSHDTNGAAAFRERFGVDRVTAYGNEDTHADLVLAGLAECCRVARRFVLVKCMEFTSSRRFHDLPTQIIIEARAHGWHVWDRIVHHTGSGPGGHNIFDPIRARRHHSYLIVLAKP